MQVETIGTGKAAPRRTMRPAALVAAWSVVAVVAGGCAIAPRPLRTQVTTFDAWSSLPAERSYVFARTLEYQDSLEMQSYEDLVGDELQRRGFTRAADPSAAVLTVTLRPSVVGASVRLRQPFGDPFYGGWGGFGPWGGWGPRLGYGYGWGGWYGAYPYGGLNAFDDYTVDVYRRQLELDIDSHVVMGKRYYEGRVEDTGPSGALPAVMPALIRALFTDFPGNSGQTRRIDVPVRAG